MVSRSHLVCFLLLPLLAQVVADEAGDQIMAEAMDSSQERLDSGGSSLEHHTLSNPIPFSLLRQVMRQEGLRQQHVRDNDDDNASDAEYDAVAKRVFCNGFTGCGGRHRDRSRRQEKYGKRLIPVLVKRPFCNSHGCYNGKRNAPISPMPTDSLRARFLAQILAATRVEGRADDRVKKLFCNGYGGCRGTKRSLFSDWKNKMSAVAASGRR